MTNELIPFGFDFEGRNVRFVAEDDGFWIAVQDVADALEYAESTNPASLVRQVPEEWKGAYPLHTPGGTQNMLCLNEQGLYFFLGRSDKPKALPFQKKAAGEILPQIRRAGGYKTLALEEKEKNLKAVTEKSLMIAQSERNLYKNLYLQERRECRRHEERRQMTYADKRKILYMHLNCYSVGYIHKVTKKGPTAIRRFLDGLADMPDAELEKIKAAREPETLFDYCVAAMFGGEGGE